MDPTGLTKDELIERLKAEQERCRALEAQLATTKEHANTLHELQVHQLELEAQNQALREAQGQLEESRSRYADLYDFAPIAYCTFDRDGIVLEINLTGASMLGRERARIIGKPFVSLVHLESPEAFSRHIQNSLDASIPVLAEIAFSTNRGPFEVQLVSAARRSPHPRPTSCRTAFLDITPRRLAEREARAAHASERVLREGLEAIDRASAAVSAALVGVSDSDGHDFLQVVVDQARNVVQAEYAALGIGGGAGQRFDPWVFSGVTAEQAAAIGRPPRGVGVLGAVIDAGRPIRLRDLREHRSFSGFASGHLPMTSFLGVPIRYQGESRGHLYLANKRGGDEFTEGDQVVIGTFADRVGIAMEIARLRQVEAREHIRLTFLAKAGPLLAESIDYEKTLATIAELLVPTAADVTVVDLVDEGGVVRTVALHHLDPTRKSLLEPLKGARRVEDLPEGVRAAIATGRPQRRDVTPEFLRDGIPDDDFREILREIRATSAISAPLILRGRVIGVLRLLKTGSERRYSDEDLPLAQEIAHHAALAIESARLYRSAQQATRARDDLLEIVSHDLRNFLATIRMGGEMLSRPGPEGERRAGRKIVESIQHSTARIDRLIESLRDATMIEIGRFTIAKKVEDAAALLHEAFKTLEPQAEVASLYLTVDPADPLPLVLCDRERVLQVIANLVGNAIKFTDPGGEIRIVARSMGEAAVCIGISDTGRGIPEGQQSHVFDRHWRGRDEPRTGAGLGLFIAKGIVEAHGGRIWVESTVAVGSTFFFTLPTASRPAAQPSGSTAPPPPPPPG